MFPLKTPSSDIGASVLANIQVSVLRILEVSVKKTSFVKTVAWKLSLQTLKIT